MQFYYNLQMSTHSYDLEEKVFHVLTSAQVQYWNREFGFKVNPPSPTTAEKLISKGFIPIVEIQDEIGAYSSLPKKSIIALLNADEKYDYPLTRSIIDCDAFIGLIRQYKVPKNTKNSLLASIFFGTLQSLRIKEATTPRRTIGWMLEGIAMKNRQTKMLKLVKKSQKFIWEIPLGYTDYFAETFISKMTNELKDEMDLRGSLLEIAETKSQSCSSERIVRFVFIGQVGQIVRRQAIEALKRLNSKNMILRDGYGGVSNEKNRALRIGEEYVDGLLNSKISICPPGNISGNSYRIMESLICGAYPAVMSNVMCDPLFESPVIEVIKERKPRTWSAYLSKLESVSDEVLKICVLENISKFESEIAIARAKLIGLQKIKF